MIKTQNISTIFSKPIDINTKSLFKTNFSPIKILIIVGTIKGKIITKRVPVTQLYFKTTKRVATGKFYSWYNIYPSKKTFFKDYKQRSKNNYKTSNKIDG